MLSRRSFLQFAAAVQLTTLSAPSASADEPTGAETTGTKTTGAEAKSAAGPRLGPSQPFTFETLKARAKVLAAKPYVAPPAPDPAILKDMNYDTARSIKPNRSRALYPEGPYPVTFLTVGQIFLKSVSLFKLENNSAREVIYSPDYFLFPAGGPLERLPPDPPPFAGFELRQAGSKPALVEHEGWARFIGASYFRAVGEADQFGLSARGLAQNTGVANPEEFPDFTHFWIEEGRTEADPVTVYALLDGPSVAGAYRFVMHRGRAVTMDITCELTLRRPIERLGLAPLTSMFWYGEEVKGRAADWRPEIHDSDGLAMWTGAGEHLWRPLINQQTLQISAFTDTNPRGFGLMQRDKTYDHYLDAVFYEKRPCGWVEPKGDWGEGTVQLVEIPTDNEIYDNIIAMWVPAEPNRAGQTLDFAYTLMWRDTDPFPGQLALCVATRLGMGAIQGAPRSAALRKFLIEFKGPILATLDEGEMPEPVVSVSHGSLSHFITEPSPDGATDHWRTQFDLDPDGASVVEMRCFLRYKGRPLTETWLYRYMPFESQVR